MHVLTKKKRTLDLPRLWRAYELDRMVEQAWRQASAGKGKPVVPAGTEIWLAKRERADREYEVRFLRALERMPRYAELTGGSWRVAFADDIAAFVECFGVPGHDEHLGAWTAERASELRELARAQVEKEFQRERGSERHWLREVRAAPEYHERVEERYQAYLRGAAELGAGDSEGDAGERRMPGVLVQPYREAMAQRCAELEAELDTAIRSARRARTELGLHVRLVTNYPPDFDALALLGGPEAYVARLAEELAAKTAAGELLLNAYGTQGFVHVCDATPEALRRIAADPDAWRRSLARTLRSGGAKKGHGPCRLAERVCHDAIDAEPALKRLATSEISRAVRSYVQDQLLAARMPALEDALARAFDEVACIDALASSERPELRALAENLAAYAADERARREAQRRATTEAAVSAQADPYLGYPARRTRPRRVVVHVGPTNAGKTHGALEAFRQAGSAVYLGPLRLLAAEVADASCEQGVPCSLVTGEERRLVEGATHVASTVEMFDPAAHWDAAVVDEAQMVGDLDRGGAWSRALIGLDADELHICCAPEGLDIVCEMLEGCRARFGDTYRVQRHERLNPLRASGALVRFPEDIRSGDACVVFSKRDVHAAAAELHEAGLSCCVVYGALPHAVRRAEARRFREGDAEVVVATDAIGMGMNLPVKRVVFLRHDKYDGRERRELTSTEVKQIAGRAGRYGYAEAGVAASAENPRFIAEALAAAEEPVACATLAFPRALLEIDAPVSMLLDAWSNAHAPAPFRCADYSEEVLLAARAERVTSDAATVYAFAMLPFKSRDERVMDLWEAILRAHVAGEPLPDFEKGWRDDDLDSMQATYDRLDLVSAYLMGPGEGRPTAEGVDVEDVALLRDEVSEDISAFLARQTYETRRCSSCGRPLPWGHRFGVCERCFHRQRLARGPRRR